MNTPFNRLAAVFEAILDQARNDPGFAAKLESALVGETPRTITIRKSPVADASSPRRSNRRAKASVDPFALLSAGEDHLRAELAKLDLEQMKDVVAEYGMDTSRLALKWKSRERLPDFIFTTVVFRNTQGDRLRGGNCK